MCDPLARQVQGLFSITLSNYISVAGYQLLASEKNKAVAYSSIVLTLVLRETFTETRETDSLMYCCFSELSECFRYAVEQWRHGLRKAFQMGSRVTYSCNL